MSARRRPCDLLRGPLLPMAGYCRHCGGEATLGSSAHACLARCAYDRQSAQLTYCELDGQRLDAHPRCRDCSGLTGEGHAQQMAEGGLCDACLRALGRRVGRRVEWLTEGAA